MGSNSLKGSLDSSTTPQLSGPPSCRAVAPSMNLIEQFPLVQMTSKLKSNPPPIRALLIDISGTLLIGLSPTPGAAQALATLRAAHIPFRFCSNTSKESSDAVHKRMRAAGLDVRREEVWTSVGALRAVLKTLGVTR